MLLDCFLAVAKVMAYKVVVNLAPQDNITWHFGHHLTQTKMPQAMMIPVLPPHSPIKNQCVPEVLHLNKFLVHSINQLTLRRFRFQAYIQNQTESEILDLEVSEFLSSRIFVTRVSCLYAFRSIVDNCFVNMALSEGRKV